MHEGRPLEPAFSYLPRLMNLVQYFLTKDLEEERDLEMVVYDSEKTGIVGAVIAIQTDVRTDKIAMPESIL